MAVSTDLNKKPVSCLIYLFIFFFLLSVLLQRRVFFFFTHVDRYLAPSFVVIHLVSVTLTFYTRFSYVTLASFPMSPLSPSLFSCFRFVSYYSCFLVERQSFFPFVSCPNCCSDELIDLFFCFCCLILFSSLFCCRWFLAPGFRVSGWIIERTLVFQS